MKKYRITVVSLLAGIVLCAACYLSRPGTAQAQEKLDAAELIRKVETQYQGKTSYSTSRMKVVTESWTREITMESWTEGRDKFLSRILTPKKEQGTATLKIGDEIWNYLPKIDRLIKIPSSLMGDSWMGSHLTNDDLVKDDKVDELYDLEIVGQEGDMVTIVGVPKRDAAVVWGKIDYTLDAERIIPMRILYYDEDDELVRTIEFDGVERVSGRWIPLRMVVRPEDKPDEMTEMVYDNLEFDISLSEDRFSLRSLRGR